MSLVGSINQIVISECICHVKQGDGWIGNVLLLFAGC